MVTAARRSMSALALAAALFAGACSSDAGTPAAGPAVTISDTWLKANTEVADNGATAAFGTLHNTSGSEVIVTGVTSSATSRTEIHEMASMDGVMSMKPVEGGITIPANGSLTLEPGGYHLMLLDLPDPVEPGEQVHFTLTLSTGGTVEFDAIAKEFAGAQESYAPMDHGDADHGEGMDHGDGATDHSEHHG